MTTAACLLLAALAEPQGSIRGRIVLAETGAPIAGVTVDLSAKIQGERYEQPARSGAAVKRFPVDPGAQIELEVTGR